MHFDTTRWSLVLAAGGDDSAAEAALATLCASYWYPLYAYVRRRGASPDDARDLTQGFVASLLDRRDFSRLRRENGRFRAFLLAALQHFQLNEAARQRTQKRGGRVLVLPLQTDDAEGRYIVEAFPDGGIVPVKYAGRGGSLQPGFKFSNAPEVTVAYAVIFHDIDVWINGSDVLHWMAWDIPAAAGSIPEGKLPEGSVQGKHMQGKPVYMGPGAPAGPRYHHYVFELYALNATLGLPPTATRDDVLKALQGKVVAKAAYVGRYRQEP